MNKYDEIEKEFIKAIKTIKSAIDNLLILVQGSNSFSVKVKMNLEITLKDKSEFVINQIGCY